MRIQSRSVALPVGPRIQFRTGPWEISASRSAGLIDLIVALDLDYDDDEKGLGTVIRFTGEPVDLPYPPTLWALRAVAPWLSLLALDRLSELDSEAIHLDDGRWAMQSSYHLPQEEE